MFSCVCVQLCFLPLVHLWNHPINERDLYQYKKANVSNERRKYFPPLKTSPSEDSGLFFCDHSSVAVVDLLGPIKEEGKGDLVKEDETNHTTSEQLKGTRRKMVLKVDSPRHLRKGKRSKKGIVKPRKVQVKVYSNLINVLSC